MHNDYIMELLNLQDKDLVINKIESNNIIKIHVHKNINKLNSSCKNCGSLNITIHNYYLRKIKFLEIAGFKSIIHYNQRRFICKDCNHTFNEDCFLVSKGSTISNATKIMILKQA